MTAGASLGSGLGGGVAVAPPLGSRFRGNDAEWNGGNDVGRRGGNDVGRRGGNDDDGCVGVSLSLGSGSAGGGVTGEGSFALNPAFSSEGEVVSRSISGRLGSRSSSGGGVAARMRS